MTQRCVIRDRWHSFMKEHYATLQDRIKAAIFDSLFVILLIYIATEILALFDNVKTYIRVLIFVFIFILYEPLFVSMFGGTIGHSRMNLTVKSSKDEKKNINLFQSLIRYLFKMILGWLSLLTIGSSEKKLAIHDSIVNSVVLSEKP